MKCQDLFFWEKQKIYFNMSSAEKFSQSAKYLNFAETCQSKQRMPISLEPFEQGLHSLSFS